MKLIILILSFILFTSCEKEEYKPTVRKDEVCVVIKSEKPVKVSGYIGNNIITSTSQCVYVSKGDSALIKIIADVKTKMTIHLYRNNKLIAYKANYCNYDEYQLTYKF